MSLIIIDAKINPVIASNPINFVYTNKGNALVRHIVSIDDSNPTTPPIIMVNNGQVTLPTGEYDCVLTTNVFTEGALGPRYDSDITINGQLAASARGSVPSDNSRVTLLTHFTLKVS